jgi:hypothetical protein
MAAERRIQRELRTVQAMIDMYCREIHGTPEARCDACQGLWRYAQARIDHCPFQGDKPTCVDCTVHCYQAAKREQIRVVMRHAGPRMIWRHPVLALFHLLDGRRPTPARG